MSKIRILFRDIIITVVVALLMFLGLHTTLQQCIVQQMSMVPTLEENQRIFINKVSFFLNGPERGDIIAFKMFQVPNKAALVKRVIGLPGETVEIKRGLVYVNGYPLEEPYIKDSPCYVFEAFTVPEQSYFVLGDNRNCSNDSHEGWTVPKANIVGKAFVSIWPPETWGLFPDYVYATDKPSSTP